MKVENVLLIGGLVFIGYWMFKKTPRIIDVLGNNPNTDTKTEPKTIILNLNRTKGKAAVLSSDVERRYNAHEFATISPAMVEINSRSNFYDF